MFCSPISDLCDWCECRGKGQLLEAFLEQREAMHKGCWNVAMSQRRDVGSTYIEVNKWQRRDVSASYASQSLKVKGDQNFEVVGDRGRTN